MSTKLLSMPQLKKTGRAVAGTGILAAAGIFAVGPIIRKNPDLAIPIGYGVAVGIPLLGIFLSKRYPIAGPAIAGAGIGIVFSSLAAVITGDYSILATNPEQMRQLQQLQSTSDLEGFPEALELALTGGA